MLQDVSAGTRAKFEISGCQPKRASQGSNNKTTTPNTNGTAQAKRTKSTNPRDNRPSQHETNITTVSSSATAQDDDDKDAMDYTPTETVSASAEDAVLEYVFGLVSIIWPC